METGHDHHHTSDHADAEATTISDVDRARVRELRRIAVQCLREMNAIIAPYVDLDPADVTSVRLGLQTEGDTALFDGVPPVWEDPCHTVYGPDGCVYVDCDPPGLTRPCPPVVIKSHA